MPSAASRRRRSSSAARRGVGRERVELVEHHQGHVGVTREPAQVVLVEGGVRVLLRVDDPHEHVHHLYEAVDLVAVRGRRRVEVREVEQDEAVERVVGDGVAPTDTQPVEQHRGGRLGVAVGHEHHGLGGRRRRATDPDGGDVPTGQHVERRGLTASRRSGERDDSVRGPVAEAVPRSLDGGRETGGHVRGEPARSQDGDLAQDPEAVLEPVDGPIESTHWTTLSPAGVGPARDQPACERRSRSPSARLTLLRPGAWWRPARGAVGRRYRARGRRVSPGTAGPLP